MLGGLANRVFTINSIPLTCLEVIAMPPHCDSMDGPVVKAAMEALETQNAEQVLPFVPKDGELEVAEAFEKVLAVRKQGGLAQEIADVYFFETVVRIHRAGEGAPFTGIKPAGLDVGPVIPMAEKAIKTGSADQLLDFMSDVVRSEINLRFDHAMKLKARASRGSDAAREYTSAMLGLEVYAHKLYKFAKAGPHEGHRG